MIDHLRTRATPDSAALRRVQARYWQVFSLFAYLAVGVGLGLLALRWQVAGSLRSGQSLVWADFSAALWTIAIGVLSNVACALVGCYLVLRRMSLLGDAISHAVLLGLAIAFLLTGKLAGWPMFFGAMAIGVLTSALTQAIASLGKVSEDTSMGVVFTSLFALGVILIMAFASKAHIDAECILYGSIDTAPADLPPPGYWQVPRAVWPLAAALLITLAYVELLWKELKIVAFDPALAAAMGLSVPAIHYSLMAMVAGVSVTSFDAVGAILVVAMLVVPAAAAALVTDRLSWMLAWAAAFGIVSAVFGYVLAAALGTSVAGMMAVVAGVQLAGAVILGPHYGLASRWLRNLSLAVRIASEDVIARLYREEERVQGSGFRVQGAVGNALCGSGAVGNALRGVPRETGDRSQESGGRSQESGVRGQESGVRGQESGVRGQEPVASALVRWLAGLRLAHNEWVTSDRPGELQLTDAGRSAARILVRAHRLWETYLDTHFDLPRDHLHDAAERMEHFLDPELQAELDAELAGVATDPHGKAIPREEKSN
jgi:ABC-type Mn2+/Zn2+ transport system permease subunit